jgi:sodium-coupled neutral amino acid transporter 3
MDHSRDEKVDLNDNDMMMEDQTFIGEKSEKKSLQEVGTWNDWNKVNFFLAIFNLMNAILGSGILGLAYAVKSLGILLYIIMLMVVAGLAFYAISLLLDMCEITGKKSYEEIAEKAYGPRGKMINVICITVHTLGAMCSFLFICKYELPPVIKMFFGIDPCVDTLFTNGDFLVFLTVLLIVGPLAAAKDISFLGYTSGFAMCCMIFCTVLIVMQSAGIPCPLEPNMPDAYWQFMLQNTSECSVWEDGSYTKESYLTEKFPLDNSKVTPFNVSSEICEIAATIEEFYREVPEQSCEVEWISLTLASAYAIPTMVFAFQCHASVLPIYAELKQASKQKMQYVSTISIGLVFIMYLLASLFGYLTFKNVTGPELFVMYSGYMPDDKIILVGRLMVLICVIFSAPLLHYPCRKALILGIWGEDRMPGKKDFSWLIWLGSMFGILTLVVLLVVYVPSIKEVFGLAGATVASMLVIVMPAGFYYQLGPEPKNSMKKRINLVVVVFGFIFIVFSVSLIIYGWFVDHPEMAPCNMLEQSLPHAGGHH